MAKTKKKYISKFTPGNFDLKVKRSRAGLGLFTLSPIKKGQCIIEYVGPVLTKTEEEASNSLYLFEVTKTITIDGAARSNKARYINHSCRPNCEIEIRKGRVFVMAKRNIKVGEELGYDYEPDYWEEYIKPKGCKCLKCSPVSEK
ncbi:MAG TPA: SET domain-containing protein-lysine N-methyltransferase [Candidatus Paceibacterota bacterium]